MGADLTPGPDASEDLEDKLHGIDPADPAFGEITRTLGNLAALYGFDPHDPKVIAGAIRYGRRKHEQEVQFWRKAMTLHPPVEGTVVYYMRIGNRCKIGYSANLAGRLDAINPEELLVTEPGGPAQEAARHSQFADLRTHGEWFRYEGALAEHVAQLQAARPTLPDDYFPAGIREPMTPLDHHIMRLIGE